MGFFFPELKQDTKHYKSNAKFSNDCIRDYKEIFVNEVCDGDTISITKCSNEEKENKIRLLGIDAFEMKQNEYGKIAKNYLSDLILKKNVCIELDLEKHDIYGRTLGYVFLGSADNHILFINEDLVKNGLALLSTIKPNTKHTDALKKAQAHARENMLGVWINGNTIKETPYEFRHKKN